MSEGLWFGKREKAATEGQVVAEQAKMSHACRCCGKKEDETPFPQCSHCQTVRYCSLGCQRKHWKAHKALCQAIAWLTNRKHRADRVNDGVYVSHLSPKEHAKLVQLVGQKCTVTCLLDGVLTEALWDTGAQVSILSHCWVKQHLPGNEVRDIGELLGRDGLALKAANGTDLPYAGWVEINFSLVGTNSADSIRVPFLVSRDALDAPIVGYNVIEEITKQSTDNAPPGPGEPIVDILTSSLASANRDQVEALVQLIKTETPSELSPVRTRKQDTIIPRGQSAVYHVVPL